MQHIVDVAERPRKGANYFLRYESVEVSALEKKTPTSILIEGILMGKNLFFNIRSKLNRCA